VNFIVNTSIHYANGGYFLTAIPTPETNREPKDEADAIYMKALQDLSDGRIEEGRKGLESSFNMGDLDSGNTLAYGYDAGWFGERDHNKANEIFRELVRKQHRSAMQNYGMGLIYGIGIRKDEERGIYWLKEAADRGDAIAMAALAKMWAFGDTCPRNYTMAKTYVLKAVNAGEPEGANTLARMYETGICFKKNLKKAFEWYHLAYQSSKNPVIIANLAKCYKKGIGVKICPEKAEMLYADAKEKGWHIKIRTTLN